MYRDSGGQGCAAYDFAPRAWPKGRRARKGGATQAAVYEILRSQLQLVQQHVFMYEAYENINNNKKKSKKSVALVVVVVVAVVTKACTEICWKTHSAQQFMGNI